MEKKEEAPISKEDAEAEIMKMLEFYFGGSNFSWDRFMQGKVCHNGPDTRRKYATIVILSMMVILVMMVMMTGVGWSHSVFVLPTADCVDCDRDLCC